MRWRVSSPEIESAPAVDWMSSPGLVPYPAALEVMQVRGEAIADGTYYFSSPRGGAKLRLVQTLRGGDTGIGFCSATGTIRVGREGNDINFPDDPFISGQHARVTWESGRLVLTDLGSKNGTFIRIAGERALMHGDYVFMGQQLLRAEIV